MMVIAACTGGVAETTVPTSESTTSAPSSTLPPVVECPGTGEFEEGGGIGALDGLGSDSVRLGRVSWDVSDRCETFAFEFETSEGAPATALPDVEVDHLGSFQVVRVALEIESSVVVDQLVETQLVDRLYVVRSLDGGMFVDLHLSAPAAVRVTALDSPARLSLQLRPGFVPFNGAAVAADDVVVVSPASDGDIPPVVDLAGYVRNERPELAALVTQGGSLVSETSLETAESSGYWGEFRARLTLPPGNVSVFVGETGPDDDDLDGLIIDLEVS